MTIYTAAGAGQSCKTLLTNLGSGLEDQGMTVTCDEVAPTTEMTPTPPDSASWPSPSPSAA
ncbi:hypothetical protein [Corynebacterium variabile]|uniref:hypothetical protein n=1 Tax=Corynebacterium variabile TaxID=1727 RepID=UPI003F8DAB05